MIIPTQYKSRLPKGLSYPIGAASLSTLLRDAPQFDELSIWFADYAVNPKSSAEKLRRSGDVYTILKAEYSLPRAASPSHYGDERGWYDPKWRIWVYAVSRNARSVATKVLVERAADVVAWLQTPRTDLWLTNSHSYDITFADAVIDDATAVCRPK